MRVLVTGGAGFIGANLVRTLLGRGHECAVLDSFATGNPTWLVDLSVAVHEGDVRQAELVDRLAAGADAIVHLGAVTGVPPSLRDPLTAHRVNVDGTLNVLQAARAHGGHVLLAGSAAVYGPTPPLPTSEDCPPNPISPYAATKLAAEQYALAWSASYGIDVLPLRFFNVYGPLQTSTQAYAAVVPAFVEAALEGMPLPIHGDGVHVDEVTGLATVADVLATAVEGRLVSRVPVNLALGESHSLLDVADTLADVLGRPLERTHLPPREGDVRHSRADQTRLRALVQEVRPVGLRDGLASTVEWASTRRRR